MPTALDQYRLLGRTGLRVSPLCLGTMTFGTEWGWGSDKEPAGRIFAEYLDAGGNFVDTADRYTAGTSEQWIGEFIEESGTRDRIVLATKFTFNAEPGNPNAGGNGRKNIYRAVEGSLRRLKTDYIDLYWLHAWDGLTPVEEVARTLDDLVTAGKVRYVGLSDTPAWYAARYQTIAELRGWERLSALQLEYSLVARNLEREHLILAQELGMGICPWSPLAGGLLTGKYERGDSGISGEGRIKTARDSGDPLMDRYNTERSWKIVRDLNEVAKEMGKKSAEVALNWVATQPGISSTIIGATKLEQLLANLGSIEFDIPAELRAKLDEASRIEPTELDSFFGPTIQNMISGGTSVRK